MVIIKRLAFVLLGLCVLLTPAYSQPVKSGEEKFGIFVVGNSINEMKDLDVNMTRTIVTSFSWAKGKIKEGRTGDLESVFTLVPRGEVWENHAVKELRDRGIIHGGPMSAVCGFPEDIEAYKQDLRLLIEKLDGDGSDDMEGLKYPIRAVQILNEPNFEWLGRMKMSDLRNINSVADLKRWRKMHAEETKNSMWEFIKINYETIKHGNPGIDIIVQDVAVSIGMPEGGMGKYAGYFDIADVHFYGDHLGLEKLLTKTRQFNKEKGLNKALLSFEMGGPMKDEPFNTPQDFREHAEEVIKLHMVAFSNGLEKVYYASLIPIPGYKTSRFKNLALLDDELNKKPAYYTYKILIKKLKGFVSIVKLRPENFYYKVNFRDKKPVYILWDDQGNKILNLSRYIQNPKVRITHIITEYGKTDKYAKTEILPTNNVKIGKTPIFIEEFE